MDIFGKRKPLWVRYSDSVTVLFIVSWLSRLAVTLCGELRDGELLLDHFTPETEAADTAHRSSR